MLLASLRLDIFFVGTASDFAGEVVEVGNGVRSFKPGDKVVAVTFAKRWVDDHNLVYNFGAVTKSGEVVEVGNGVRSFKPGDKVVAVTFAKRWVDDHNLVYNFGAVTKSASHDAVIQCATGIPLSTFEPNLSANGKVIDMIPGVSAMWTFALKKLTFSRKQLVPHLLIPKGRNLKHLVKLVSEGKLKTLVDSKHPLSKAEDAWAKSIDGHATGKIIVEPCVGFLGSLVCICDLDDNSTPK
ncbi:unnamed protein product [Ilex paraguariensis]|uniref:Alcohol dehydrogenase N-terminal domain-containing protein n=1 Tax=Ilex paraguariensis TaxID=185542 RepID=A0ABC8R7C7_9AQUA